ncbi:MAG: response regulator [Ignavibacteriae bacterium]|nr:response regulator [Ignavibacteriota bacterium]
MNKRILLVDDDYDVLSAYKRNLRRDFEITTANNGIEGIERMRDAEPFAVVVSDFNMPKMNGIEFLKLARKAVPDTVRVMLTGFADLETATVAVNQGNVFRFLTKPVNAEAFISSLNDCCAQYQLITSEKELLDKTLKGSIKILIDILSFTNPSIFNLSSRYRTMSKKIGEALGIRKLWEVEIAALLSQIGIITIPPEILEKKSRGETFSPEEESIYRTQSENSRNLLKNIPRLEEVANAIQYQDKNYNEFFVENKVVNEEEFPIISRILKAAIDFENSIQKGLNQPDSLRFMKVSSHKYDPQILDALERVITGVRIERVMKQIRLKDLRISMIIAEDIKDDKGNILLRKGYEITDVLLLRLMNASKVRSIIEPIFIFE